MTNQLPDECAVSVEHALVHLRSAQDCLDDVDQVAHDLDIAIRILDALETERKIPAT